jgi:hypothetical protein
MEAEATEGLAVHAFHFATFNPIVASHRLLKPSPGKHGKRIYGYNRESTEGAKKLRNPCVK